MEYQGRLGTRQARRCRADRQGCSLTSYFKKNISMNIPEDQLRIWSHQGATETPQSIFKSVCTSVKNFNQWKQSFTYNPFIQGSYANSTNVYKDSDVDIVLELISIFFDDISQLPQEQQNLWTAHRNAATYTIIDFKNDIYNALTNSYKQESITIGNKSIKISESLFRMPVDVVPCFRMRKFTSYTNPQINSFHQGIAIYDQNEGRFIPNFPFQHLTNGLLKNSITQAGERYKQFVRLVKNIRNYLVEKKFIEENLAPSYFLECLIYNVPNNFFTLFRPLTQHFIDIFGWLNNSNISNFICQNAQFRLFQSEPPQYFANYFQPQAPLVPQFWKQENARAFIQAAINLWNNW